MSLKKRHRLYVTILTDLTDPERPEVLAVAAGRDEAAGRNCLERLSEGQRRQVRTYRADMAPAFHAACRGLLPNARAVVDRFHVAKKFSEAVDRERGKNHPGVQGGAAEGPADAGATLHDVAQRAEIGVEIGMVADAEFRDNFLPWPDDNFACFGKSLFRGEGGAVFDDHDVEAGRARDLREIERHVAAAE